LSLGLIVHPIVRFSTACSKKNVQSVSPLRDTDTEIVSPFVDSIVNDVLLQNNPDFTNHLKFNNNPEGHLVNTLLHDSQTMYLTGCYGTQVRRYEIY